MIERLGARARDPAAVSAAAAAVDGAETVDATGPLAEVDAAEAVAAAPALTVAELLAAPPAEHRARSLDLGETIAGLARAAARPAVPGEPAAQARLREVVARYLALRLEVVEGVARISIG